LRLDRTFAENEPQFEIGIHPDNIRKSAQSFLLKAPLLIGTPKMPLFARLGSNEFHNGGENT